MGYVNASRKFIFMILGLLRNMFFKCKRVTRPKGGINEWLHWLPVGFHKKLDFILRHIYLYSRLMLGSKQSKYIKSVPSENGGNVGLASILEADVKSIVNMARQTYEKYVIFLKFLYGACLIWTLLRFYELQVVLERN